MTHPATTAPVTSSTGAVRSCYACGGYLYRGARHRTCEPKYRRHRFQPCDVCGKLARGRVHRLCANPPSEWSRRGSPPVGIGTCGYCGAMTRGAFHKRCAPVGLGDLAVFPDDPHTVQRRCSACREWFPFAATDGAERPDTAAMWKPAGRTPSGRPVYHGVCRACVAQQRREYDARKVA